ncbi:hypothetical protein E1B28_005933 [Marasmius oreades]|uniref:chitinase n=1 Tax=Marasmius oreades TaxID=181124 RepID=A0A9P7S485_9AGAR|nr:uncharacterized protein E1B28_005933 [Marasmius oreades]KAG7095154.1 hypothetical protein E1B28_005933 [Marasmius oreades]
MTPNLMRILSFLSTVAFVLVHATQVMHRPDKYKESPNVYKTEANPKTNTVQKRATGKVQFAYFVNWGIYPAYNFQPTDIDPSMVTHILYSFADVSPATGAVSLTDLYADQDKRFPTDSWNDSGNNLYGCLKQLYLLKLANRQLKVLLSIGGWTYSQNGHFSFVTNPASRANFVQSAVQLIEDYGLDGIDIDFEYPSSSAEGQGFADLVSEIRKAFDDLANRKGDLTPYLLSAAVAAGAANNANLNIQQMDSGLNYWNLMAYDYAGSWLNYSDNQANLYGGQRTGVNTDQAISYYLSSGATASKITMGIPLYGRAFENTNGLGQPYSGIGPGSVESGVYNYNALPLAGSQVSENTTDVSSYSYDSAKKELVSYDTPNIVKIKAQYVKNKGLAGTMYWQLATDKKGQDSLVLTSVNVLGALDQTENHIKFPSSKWDNIKNNMGASTGGGGGGSGGSGCTGVAAWISTTAYTGGQSVTYNGHLYVAKWWTQNEVPGKAEVWTDGGVC